MSRRQGQGKTKTSGPAAASLDVKCRKAGDYFRFRAVRAATGPLLAPVRAALLFERGSELLVLVVLLVPVVHHVARVGVPAVAHSVR